MAAFQSGKQKSQIRREGWVGDDSHVVLVKGPLVKKEVWDGALL
jgi:hypothetical protein